MDSFHNLAYILEKTYLLFIKILSEWYLWTRKSPIKISEDIRFFLAEVCVLWVLLFWLQFARRHFWFFRWHLNKSLRPTLWRLPALCKEAVAAIVFGHHLRTNLLTYLLTYLLYETYSRAQYHPSTKLRLSCLDFAFSHYLFCWETYIL